MGPLMHKISKLRLVRFDVVREEPIRDKSGFCVSHIYIASHPNAGSTLFMWDICYL
jgi:hypothetical protein